MALLEDLGTDLATVKASEVEEQIKAGPLVPVGLHHAVLDGFRAISANNGRSGRELTFKIVAGPAKGKTVKEALWNSDEAAGKNRMKLFAHRLGVLAKKNDLYVAIPGKTEFSDVVGAECVVEVKHKPRKYKDDKGVEHDTVDCLLTFEGVLPLDDKRCVNVVKADSAAVAEAKKKAAAGSPTEEQFKGL